MLPSYHFNIKTTKIIKFLTDEVGTLYISKLVKKNSHKVFMLYPIRNKIILKFKN